MGDGKKREAASEFESLKAQLDRYRAEAREPLETILWEAQAAQDCLPGVQAIKDAVNGGDLDELRDALYGVACALNAIKSAARAALSKAKGGA